MAVARVERLHGCSQGGEVTCVLLGQTAEASVWRRCVLL